MAKLNRDAVITEALDLLDEVGLDKISTRGLARRLGVEQPSLYYHFAKKEDLLSAMAEAAMAPHATAPLPTSTDDWYDWFLENHRSFRRTLLIRRDGARLHAGIRPSAADRERIGHKMAFLIGSGFSEHHAQLAMLAASRFTVGSVLEEQAEADSPGQPAGSEGPRIDHELAYEAGLALIADGFAAHRTTSTRSDGGARLGEAPR
ncbi:MULTISPECIES: TetR/AcrR family transcriptional regulator C-terminal domain-containing protein [Pseudonocardia]|uniref:Tetracycline repressor protein class A n=2 Tax=Pseudonocardia TaxID=1847 RepID=A0A1Y2N5M1_PSEAH|nr:MULTISPECIES: TetR/AcrR family transcriptional regulator C-terminal domain-containing protein [Pseudonocardia]OSY42770.1 Tetracycline repressor protein class A [Pseudonocardia autotrophica]TDN77347.1 TetR family transcriptional regulator [Pseudonocardia autotrophica]BBG01369.1 TetR family transcriptional regulator [Pseudonocardia autotrophica]GEC24425.1 TetR family transcriptional regulator [Pseudonocardia saturnea]